MAGNALSDLRIFNNALYRLGETYQVTAIDGTDTSKYGLFAGAQYNATRDEEIRTHQWKFALKRSALIQAYYNGTATWSSAAYSMVASGIPIIQFVGTSVLNAASDIVSRTLTVTGALTPTAAWIGQNVSGTGIAPDTVIRTVNVLNNTVELSRPVTASGASVTFSLCPLRVGWLVTSGLTPGNVIPSVVAGITTGTYITNIAAASPTTLTITLSNITTAGGTAVSLCFQAQNNVGYWYMYKVPADAIRGTDLYSILPSFVYLFPWKVVHQNAFPFRIEGQYIYTDLDPSNGNPYIAYLAEVTDYTLYDQLFTDALTLRLASKMCLLVTGGEKLKAEVEQEYGILVTRAQIYNLMEMDNSIEQNSWWTDRELP
jgi:hypothetical protein